MQMCTACRVNPGDMSVRGFPICYNCTGKAVHQVGDVVGITDSTKSSLITGGMGLFLLAALAGTMYIYAKYPATGERLSRI